MKVLFLATIFLITVIGNGQNIEKVIVSDKDPYHFYINDNDSSTLYYYKMVPKEKPIGVLTIIPSGGETTEN